MVTTYTCTGLEPNLERPLENRPFRSSRTGNGYNGRRTVRGNSYTTKPGEGEGI